MLLAVIRIIKSYVLEGIELQSSSVMVARAAIRAGASVYESRI